MNSDAIRWAYIDGVKATFETLFQEQLAKDDEASTQPVELAGIDSSISFTGDNNAVLHLCIPKETSEGLVERFIGAPLAFDDADMGDAVAELVNIAAGDVVARLADLDCEVRMGLPSVMKGQFTVVQTNQEQCLSLPVRSSSGKFHIQVLFKPSETKS